MASTKKLLSSKSKASTSKKTKQLSLFDTVDKAFVGLNQSHTKIKSMTVALSGGVDSVVLLHLLHSLQKKHRFTLNAIHIHHGLSKNADKWVKFCEKLCRDLSVPLDVNYVKLPQKKSLGIEGEARRLRYEKLLQSKSDLIVLAHHEDDQAETFLLQLIRGAGVKGLSSMAHFDGARKLWRPLLNASRMDIEKYAKTHKLKWIEDESNQNIDFDRNFIRSNVLPILKNRFNHIIKVISRSSAHLAEAQNLLDDLAKLDLKSYLKWFKLPSLILNGLNIFFSSGLTPYLEMGYISLLTMGVSMICSILNSIELYLGIEQGMSKELVASKDYYLLATDIYKVLVLDRENRSQPAKEFLEEHYARYTKLFEHSNLLNKKMKDSLKPVMSNGVISGDTNSDISGDNRV